MYSKFLFASLLAFASLVLWVGCEKDEGTVTPPGENPVGSIQIFTECPNDTLRFFENDSVSIWAMVIVTDDRGFALPGVPIEVSLSAPQLGVIEFTDPQLLDTTNAVGRVSMLFHSLTIAGNQLIIATAGGVTSTRVLALVEVERPASGFTLFSNRPHDTLYIAPGYSLTIDFAVNFFDANANPVSDYDGMFISSSATGGHLERFSVISNGQATSTWTFHNEYGPFQARIFGYLLDPFTILPDTTG